MSNAATARTTARRENYKLGLGLIAGAVALAGTIAAVDAAGNVGQFGVTAGAVRVVGVFESDVDNTGGIAGARTVNVLRGCHKLANDGSITKALWAANRSLKAVALDNQTVGTGGNGAVSAVGDAGYVVEVDSDGVWVDFKSL